MRDAAHKERRRHSLINSIGALLLIVAAALTGLMFYFNSPHLQEGYALYLARMEYLENIVVGLNNTWLILLVVLALYAFKGVFSFFPVSMLCFITGAALPMTLSLPVNVVGLVLWYSIKYWWGRHLGGGQIKRLLALNKDIRTFLEGDSKSKPWLLFVFRLAPFFPVNTVSQIYGAMGFDYFDYVLISLLGFLPKLISYLYIGRNSYRPLSIPFLIPLIILFTLSGISTIGINLAVSRRQKDAA